MNAEKDPAETAHDGVPHGAKGTYRKVTVTLPPDAYECLVQECARRKIAGKPNHLVSAVVRQALMQYLGDNDSPCLLQNA